MSLRIPDPTVLWRRALVVAWILLALFLWDGLTFLLFDYWLLNSMDLGSVFSTNFSMGSKLFVVGAVGFAVGVIVPAFVQKVPKGPRNVIIQLGIMGGLIGGYLLSLNFAEFLVASGKDFGENDPVFSKDLSFYVFTLPAVWIGWTAVMWSTAAGLVSALVCSLMGEASKPATKAPNRLVAAWSRMGTMTTRVQLGIVTAVAVVGVWLSRYSLLFANNEDSSVHTGAAYVDVAGLFSTLNYIWVTAVVLAGLGAVAIITLARLYSGATLDGAKLARVALALMVFDFGFRAAVEVRQLVGVGPNEPVIQLDYIARHVEATRKAYKLEGIDARSFSPNWVGDPLPNVEELVSHPTVKNASLWPGYVSMLERHLDVQHSQRVLKTNGDPVVYGPTLDVLRQHQQLRTYYDFMNVDTVRYTLDGEKRMFISAVRELPLYEPDPWLAYWGQRYMLFTHGYGLVMAPTGEVSKVGEPNYVVSDIPASVEHPDLQVKNPSIYYGEGSSTMAFSNVRDVEELDYPTEQDRAVTRIPPDANIGVRMDSLIKRLVFGWRSQQYADMLFSDLLEDETRVHYFRSPTERLHRVAPFLYFDSNPYAIVADGDILWMVNALSYSDVYPYSQYEVLGDKSDERAPFPGEQFPINYVEDSVKATVNAATGDIKLYKISDDPVISAWADVYPDLFEDGEKMPAKVRAQMTYPVHLFHIQFDDLYIYYHMEDAMYFFNLEDMWDDADEVVGPIIDEGKAITFSIEPSSQLLATGGALPDSSEELQYTMSMGFTPENARNLRAMPIAYQDGEDYGKLAVLQVPKGTYIMSPEQADAAIDQDPIISQHFSWWNRRGTEVIRGHTSSLIVGNELIYVEPIFLRSKQNPITQLKKVAVVFRGSAHMADSLEEALRQAVESAADAPSALLQPPPVADADDEEEKVPL